MINPSIMMQSASLSYNPGHHWLDTDGQIINAHGGGFLYHEGRYYWYGEIRLGAYSVPVVTPGDTPRFAGFSCYSSGDLINWENEGTMLPASGIPSHDLHHSRSGERPKVVFNRNTGKFVMWFHLDSPNYQMARSAVAVSDSPTGPFVYSHSIRPNGGIWPRNVSREQCVFDVDSEIEFVRDHHLGQMARDMTLFIDDDGTAYHFYCSEENQTMHVSRLTDDYMWPAGDYVRIFEGRFMEAPAIFKRFGKYYMIASGCTAWDPNAARSAVADELLGTWTELENPCVGEDRDTTFHSQGTYVLPVPGRDDAYIFMADRWNEQDLSDSRYIWLPLRFDDSGNPFLEWVNSWDLSDL